MKPSRPFARGEFRELPEAPRLAHSFHETEGLDLQIDSSVFGAMNVHVRKFGAGPPLLLVHGLMTSSYSWRYVYRALGAEFTCYAPDLPANGRSAAPLQASYSPENLSLWLVEVQRELGIYGCRTVANSMGGYLAMVTALRDPKAMSHLVNLHSPGIPEPRLWALKAAFALPGSARLLRWMVRRDPMRWAHRNVHYYDESLKSKEEAREYGGPLESFAGAQGFVKYLSETMSVTDMRSFQSQLQKRKREAQTFPIPLLLLYATSDPMVPPRIGSILSERIPSAEILWLDKASHFAHVDAPISFLAPTIEFLQRD